MKIAIIYVCGFILAGGLLSSEAGATDAEPKEFWETVHRYEVDAIRDYRHRNKTPDVLKRSEELWHLSISANLTKVYRPCTRAAARLSQMSMSALQDFRKGRFPRDWHDLLPRYKDLRSQCLATLGLSADDYPLPWWFGL